jgi:hypothetical protein
MSFSTAYFSFEPCCGGTTLYFAFDSDVVVEPSQGINIYEGPAVFGYDPITGTYLPLSNQCYKLVRGSIGDGGPITGPIYGSLPMVPTNTASNYTFDSTTNYESVCGDEVITCPDCTPTCYVIYSCTGQYPPIATDTDLSAYVNGYAYIQVSADFGYTCFYVVESTDCKNLVTVEVDGDTPCSCDCTCYEIIGTAELEYIDCNGNVVSTTVNGYWKDCSQVYPYTSPGPGPSLTITSQGECIDGQCPTECYELVDCEGIRDNIYTTAQSLSPMATLGQTVIIEGYDNCWTVSEVVSCDCAIDVAVLQVYDDCTTCKPNPNYKLTNCDDSGTIIYTSSDLSTYVGQVVQVEPDCPGCWIVEEVNGPIPSDTAVTVSEAFDDCEACKDIYYSLTDCTGTEATIITNTDLSAYIGQIITLEWCPTTCWTVAVSQTSEGSGILGDISGQFSTCVDCLTSFPCVCKRIKNHDTVDHDYNYVDCTGVVQTITILAGERSERICMTVLLTSYSTDYVETFGDCIDGECPPPVYPRRSLRPGYNTPHCTTWKYEEISCKAAEALYKQVLELRYGITNCCPEEDQEYLIKKQLIDLKALVNPDYTCTTPSCGCNTGCNCGGSCGSNCGCSSAGRTCES